MYAATSEGLSMNRSWEASLEGFRPWVCVAEDIGGGKDRSEVGETESEYVFDRDVPKSTTGVSKA